MRERDQAFVKARKTKKADDLIKAKQLRRAITQELRNAKRAFIIKQIDVANGDSKKFWEEINKEFFSKQKAPTDQVRDDINGTLLEGVEAAENINQYFCNISNNLAA